MSVRIKKRDAGSPIDELPTRAIVMTIAADDLLAQRSCHVHLDDAPTPGDYVLVEKGMARAIVRLGKLHVIESGRGHRKVKGIPFEVQGVFKAPLSTNVPVDALGVIDDLAITLTPEPVAPSVAPEPEPVAKAPEPATPATPAPQPAAKQVALDEAGEGGVHSHALDRRGQLTAEDGAHQHVFVLPSGEVVVTSNDGLHQHQLKSEAADVAEAGTSAHTHAVILPDGTKATTLADGEHMHTLQVRQSAFDGAHQHELVLEDGTTLLSLTAGEYFAQFGDDAVPAPAAADEDDEDEDEGADKRSRLRDKLSSLHAATRGLKLSSHALSLIDSPDDSITLMVDGALSPAMRRSVESAIAKRLPESVAQRLRVIGDTFGVPRVDTVPIAQVAIDFDDVFDYVIAKGDTLTRQPVGKQRAVMQYVFDGEGSFATVLRVQADDEVISWTLDASARADALHEEITSVRDVSKVVSAADLDGSRYQQPLRGTSTPAVPSVHESLVMLDHVGKVYGADVSGMVATVAKAEAEFGLQLDGFHEYFMSGDSALRGIVVAKRNASGGWAVTVTKALLPAVLSAEAVEAGVMPPLGCSALPSSLEREVPEDLRYWRASTAKAARALRDALVKTGAFRDDTVELVDGEFRRVYVRVEQSIAQDVAPVDTSAPAPSPPPYTDPVRKVAALLPDDGADVVLFDRSLAAKLAPSRVRELASEAARKGEDFLIAYPDSPAARLTLAKAGRPFKLAGHGDTLFVTSVAIRSDAVEWLPDPAPMVEVGGSERVASLLKRMGTEHVVRVCKTPEERFVLGIVLEPETVDAQGDIYSEEEIRKAAHLYMEEFAHIKLMHAGGYIEGKVKILENYVTHVAMEVDGQPVKRGTWMLGVRVLDDSLWDACKQGDLTGFSIGGTAVKTPL